MRLRRLSLFVIAICLKTNSLAASPLENNQTPQSPEPSSASVAALRPFTTDRPSKTESPYTIDRGHFAIESDLVSFIQDQTRAGEMNQTTFVGTSNLKFGLLHNTDIQLIIEPYRVLRTETPDQSQSTIRSGFGNTTFRIKQNLWGNDDGSTAFAAMPYLVFPTAQSDLTHRVIEWGVILPFQIELPSEWTLGLMAQYDVRKNTQSDGSHLESTSSIVIGRGLTELLSFYVELWHLAKNDGDSVGLTTHNVGFTYLVDPNLQLDAGIHLGTTDSADDVQIFTGISYRL